MEKSVHGHEIMQMMMEAKQSFTTDSLEQKILEVYGPDVRFHTCSAENMTARELIQFLSSRGKFIAVEQGFQTDSSKICDH